MLDDLHLVGKAEADVELHLVVRLVRPVPAPPLGGEEDRLGEGTLPGQLRHVVLDAVFIEEVGLLKFPRLRLIPQLEGDPGVHHRLALHHVLVVLHRHGDVREDVQVRQPAGPGAGLLGLALGEGGLAHLAHQLAPLEVELILKAVPPDRHIHVAGGVLGGAGAQAVEAQGVLVVLAAEVIVLAAGVELAVDQLPVEAALLLVPVHGAAAAGILHLDGPVQEARHGDALAVARPGLVDGVGEDLKDGVLAALQGVGAEDHRRALSHPVRTLQRRDAVVAVILACCHRSSYPPPRAAKDKILNLYYLSITRPPAQVSASGNLFRGLSSARRGISRFRHFAACLSPISGKAAPIPLEKCRSDRWK